MRTNFKQRIVILFFLLAMILASNVFAWGKNGHRVTGLIAERHLTEGAKNTLKSLLGGDSLAEVSTWADEMRSSPEDFWQKASSRWHYINLKRWSEFDQYKSKVPYNTPPSNIYYGILRCITVLQSRKTSHEEKALHFRFLVHLVGDAHQPLHVGRKEDRGGNDINVYFFNEETNLHSLWDTKLIESEQLSFTEFADFIDTQDASTIREYLNVPVRQWLKESHEISRRIYAGAPGKYSWAYKYEYMPVLKARLQKAGIRLAGLLNHLFDPNAKPGINALSRGNLK